MILRHKKIYAILTFVLFVNYAFIVNLFFSDINGFRPIVALLIGFFIFISMIFKEFKVFRVSNFNYIFIFLIIMIGSTFITPSHNYGFNKTMQFIYINITLFLTPYLLNFSEKDLKIFYKILLIINLITIFASIAINFRSVFFEKNYSIYGGSLSYFGLNPISLGRNFAETIILLLFIDDIKFIHKFRFVFITVLTLLLIKTNSMGPIIAMFISILISNFKAINKYKDKKQSLIKVIKFLLIFIVFGFILMVFVDKGIIFKDTKTLSENWDNGRIRLYKLAFNNIVNHPFFGQGIGSFSYIDKGIDTYWYPHNVLVEILVELGIIGALMFFIPIAKVLIVGIKTLLSKKVTSYYKVTYALLIFYIVNAFFSADIPGNANIFIYLAFVDIYNSSLKTRKI